MEKIKNILNPGHKDDENTMYGSQAEKDHADRRTSTVADDRQAATNAEAHENAPMDDNHGVLRQIVNPNHDKYNETQYGPAGTNTAQTELPPSVGADQTLYTKPSAEKKEHGILRQILNPGGSRYDDVAFGSTATTTPPKQDLYSTPEAREADTQRSGVLRQVLNPGGDKYDPIMNSTTATNNPAALEGDTAVTSPPVTKGSEIDPHHTGGGLGSTSLPHREKSTSATDGLQVVDTAAGPRIPGSSITAPGLAAAAVNDGTTGDSSLAAGHHTTVGSTGLSSSTPHSTTDTPMNTVHTAVGDRIPGTSITNPGHASAATADGSNFGSTGNTGSSLTAPATSGFNDAASTASVKSGIAGRPQESSGVTNFSLPTGVTDSRIQRPGDLPEIPATGGQFLDGSSGDRAFPLSSSSTTGTTGLNDGRAGLAGAAGAATGLGAFTTHEHGGHQHNYEGPVLGGEGGREGHAPGGPHVTRIANMLDPHMSGSSERSTTAVPPLASTISPASAATTGSTGPTAGLTSSGMGSSGTTVGDSSLNRGVGDSTGPASQTVGPHSSNLMNIMDPRVKPDFSSPKDTGAGVPATGAAYQETASRNTSAAPVQGERGLASGTANPYSSTALDPRVDGGGALGGAHGGKQPSIASAEAQKHHHHPHIPHRDHTAQPEARDTPSMFRTDVGDAPAPNPTGGATIGTASGTTATVPSAGNASTTTTGQQMSSGVEQEKKHARELDEARSHEAERAHNEHEGEKKEGFLHKLLHRSHKDESH